MLQGEEFPLSLEFRALERELTFDEVSYRFCIHSGPDAWRDLARKLVALEADRFLVVADGGLAQPAVREVATCIGDVAPVVPLPVVTNESAKNLATIDALAERAITAGATRRSVVIALGGGLAGNVAGLLAALLYRGVRLVHLPTTLLAMSDSVLSLKQAVNSRYGKNHLGTFHPPALVWNQLDFLDSLPAASIRSALCETIKNVLGIVPERYDELAGRLRPDARYSKAELTELIELCVAAKCHVMRHDSTEKHEALVLEYGHTVGHAIELVSQGRVPHGFAIGLGLLVAARVSVDLGQLDRADEAAHRRLLELNGAPVVMPDGLDLDAVMDAVRLDNKRGYLPHTEGKCDMVLLDALGRPHRTGESLMTQVDEDVIRSAIQSVFAADPAAVVA
ncbi:2-deoxy-scyllo-inosose synthase [Streptomyces atriruber]|uniref:2-deoxy-scyllo-inosose synthase n=1 Tax=Streptomyces atriruber TaxID=545121 RepID=UPI0006E4498E|nr:2-deoxy-scyllo-inosose synthase [Streptomyces atriruber]